jgi:hypothetical protein
MSSEQVRKRVEKRFKATKEFLLDAKKSIQGDLFKRKPKVVHTLDSSIDVAGKALSNALSSIDKKTASEQMQLLGPTNRSCKSKSSSSKSESKPRKKVGHNIF